MRSKNRTVAALSAAVVSVAITAASAAAGDVVVIGSVNPVTGQTTLLTDKLKKNFPDGGPIAELYLLERPGEEGGFALVRAGRQLDGACHTELIATEVSGGDVLLRKPLHPLFSCEEIDERCRSIGVLLHGMCLPTTTFSGCKCLSDATGGGGAKCEKVNDPLWNPEMEDVVNTLPAP